MLWESCSSSYTENHKIGVEIFGFFCDFIRILQVAARSTQRVRNLFAQAPGQNTLEVSGASQCGPRAKGRCGRPESGEAAGGMLGNSGKPVTLETLSLTKFSKHVFQEQGIHDSREPGTCEASNSRMCKVRES
jgi:hypothetical protein